LIKIGKNICELDKNDYIKVGNIIVTTNLAASSGGMILRHPILQY